MTDEMNRIADKIQKLLDKTVENGCTEDEAKAALLKAQKMMAEYSLSQSDLAGGQKIVYSLQSCKLKVNPRSKVMSSLIAESFACKAIIRLNCICFFGREDNAKAAKSSMEFIHRMLERGMNAECRKHGLSGTAQKGASLIYNAYAKGFIEGLKEQLDSQCVALAIVVPQDVKDEFAKKFPNLRRTTSKMTCGNYASSYLKGKQDGRSAMNKRSLEA